VRTGSNQWFAYYNNNSGLRSSTISGVAADGADKVWFSHAPDTGVSVRGAWLPPLADSVPIISSISPDHGSAGDYITINGTGFGSNSGAVQVTIGGAYVDVLNVSLPRSWSASIAITSAAMWTCGWASVIPRWSAQAGRLFARSHISLRSRRPAATMVWAWP